MSNAKTVTIAELNQMAQAENGVFHFPGQAEFAYSDGEASETLLHQILSTSDDLRSDSVELKAQICDWPTEYHLSAARANLLRPFDLRSFEHVLELGCGCGSISRYLAEQAHLKIDAVEGSPRRAQLAALRCRDKNNVAFHTGNFNQIQFPQAAYDLILLIGVTEYAGRFSDQESDQAALQEILAMGHQALKPGGVVMIAIENRLGMKYLLGASEDHYGVPWVGLDDYPESTGIRTYSKSEWQAQIALSPFSGYRFCYPFPDYKIPSLVMADSILDPRQGSFDKIRSRDYLRYFEMAEQEDKLWQGVHQANAIDELSNSFLILLSDDSEQLKAMTSFNRVEFETTAYEWHLPVRQANSDESIKSTQLLEENERLVAELNLIKSSRGWRLLNVVRRLFRPFLDLISPAGKR